MAFVDEIQLHIKAGDGGNGVVRWLHEKGREFAGPAGGDGGKGGDVYVKALRDLSILNRYRNVKEFEAKKGFDGERNSRDGKDGQLIKILKGGRGGIGNEEFRSSTNIRPERATSGKPGEEADFFIELELVADAGLVGFPNAGKSSILNVLSHAKAKVGDYKFTTLEPNLGELYGFIIADIPGLIEGASKGKGLGHAFLRHIKRTKMIIHCLSLENENIVEAYKTIRKELESYGETLPEKKEIVLLTKTDLVSPEVLKDALKKIKKINKDVYAVSILDDTAIKKLKDTLVKILR